MLFSYFKDVDTPGFECRKNVFLLYFEDDNTCFSTVDVINDRSVFERLHVKGLDAKYAVIPGSSMPVIVLPDEVGTQVTTIYNQLAARFEQTTDPDDQMKLLSEVRNMLAPKVGAAAASALVSAIKLQLDWESNGEADGPLALDVGDVDPDFKAYTANAVKEINSQFVQAITSISSAENYTRFQEKCSSELFIAIPDRRVFQDDVSMQSILPKRDEVCVPYPDDAAYTPDYVAKGVPAFMFPLIEGDKKNNGAPLYENEKVYHKALTEWVRFNVAEEFGNADGTVIDLLSQRYLLELMTVLYMWHWGHNPCVPAEVSDVRVSDDSDDDAVSRYSFRYTKQGEPKYNAVIILHEFIKEVSAKLGYQVFVDAVIQLARWGERKPTRLVFEGFDREFDLGTGLVRHKVGDINDYSVVPVNGKQSELVALIYDDARIQDSNIKVNKWEFPVGIVTKIRMQNSAGEKLELLQYVHCIDVVSLAKQGELSVLGIECSGGSWQVNKSELEKCTVSELIKDYDRRKDSLLQFPFYRSSQLAERFIELQANNARIPANLFTIMNTRVADPNLKRSVENAVFHNKEEMYQLIADGVVTSVVTAVELSVVRDILPKYEAVAESGATTLQDTLGAWEAVMGARAAQQQGRTQSVTSFSRQSAAAAAAHIVKPVAEQPVKRVQPSKPVAQAVSVHSPKPTTITQTQAAQQTAQKPAFNWIKIVPEDAKLVRIVNGEQQTVGYCCYEEFPNPQRPGKIYRRYIVVGLNSAGDREVLKDSAVLQERIFALVIHNIYLSVLHGRSVGQVFFDSVQTLQDFRDKLNEVYRSHGGVI